MSELTKKYCVEQIKRLSQKPFFMALGDEGMKELARTLFEGAKTPEHAERIITRACRTNFGKEGESRCPDANEIWALCRNVPVDRKMDIDATDFKPSSNEPCERCRNSIGYIVVTLTGSDGHEYTAARKCPCGAVPSLTPAFPKRAPDDAPSTVVVPAVKFVKPVARSISEADIEALKREQERNRRAVAE